MPAVKQVVDLTDKEIRDILIEHCKEVLLEAGGKQVQGSSKVEFFQKENGEFPKVITATVSFERAGK